MAQRKLQAEIDRTLKAVTAGVEVFESTFDKLGMSSNATQKDKLETDLKTQIKKLQRMRDTIKAWIGSSDIKDKSALTDSRKLIEAQMERFKALEKEMKMKAFSKEGLIAQAKLDPAERAKKEIVDWIGTTVDELSRQIEQTEAEMEVVQGGSKKKKAMGEKMGELEELNERRVWHNSKLEIVQRMLENGQLQVDQVEVIQEDVKYFVEANAEEDFDFDDGLYEDLNLQEEDEYLQDISHNDDLSNLDSSSAIDMNESTTPPVTATALKTPAKERAPSISLSASAAASATKQSGPIEEPPSPILAKKQPSRKSTLDSTKLELPTKATKAEPTPPVPTTKTSMPPIRYAAAVAGPTTSSTTTTTAAPAPVPQASLSGQEVSASPVENKSELPELTPAISEPPREEKELALPAPTPAPVPEPTPRAASTNGHLPPPPPPGLAAVPAQQPQQQQTQAQQYPPTGPSPAPSMPPGYAQPQAQRPQQQQQGESSRTGAYSTSPRGPPGVLSGLMQTFETAKGLSEQRSGDLNELHSALDGSFNHAPSQLDGEPYYHPKNRVKTPSYYPQTRLRHLTDRQLLSRLDLDQLFYIFYYREGTYEQWCVAEELKKQAWRFHKQYLTWFQRAASPTAVTDDYEQGPYTYFDWENVWCQRRKTDFRFEYRYLSEY